LFGDHIDGLQHIHIYPYFLF